MLGLGDRFVSLLGISMLWCISHVLAALFLLCPPWRTGPNQTYFEMLPSTLFSVLIYVNIYCGEVAFALAVVILDGNCDTCTMDDLFPALWQRLVMFARGNINSIPHTDM